MGAAFMSMTVADCFALCVLVALFVGTAAFWIGQGSFGLTTPKAHPSESKPSNASGNVVCRRNGLRRTVS